MGKLSDAPERVKPLAGAAPGRHEKTRAERPGCPAEIAPGMAEPSAERPRQPFRKFVQTLALRGEQLVARGEATQAGL